MPDHMNPESHPDPLAAVLAKLRPAPASAEKPAFLFRAGQASREAAVRRWKWLAGTAVGLLAVSWAVGVSLFAETDRRLAESEARVRELTAAALAVPPVAPPVPPAPPSVVPPVPPPFAVPDVPSARPADPYFDPDPTPRELADALRHRNEILIGGLTMLPTPNPPPGGNVRPLPGGVFATPKFEPNKLPPVFPDDENE